MENIIEPNKSFDFSKLSLAHPIGIQGGAYFTKIDYNNKPLYIQTNKGQTRQGVVKSGKKYYCDLMFDKNSETLIHWFENLEEKCQNLVYNKRDSWFQNSLEESDIETAFNSPIRIYKSGKFYLIRVNLKNSLNNNPSVKIYNENEIPKTIEDIKVDSNIICILEIQGIKFTTRNFQIEIELKQVMLLDNEPIFENCLIKKSSEKDEKDENNLTLNDVNSSENINKLEENNTEEFIISKINDIKDELIVENDEIDLEIKDLTEDIEDIEENNNELKEINQINIDEKLENNLEIMQLKKPNQVYMELYKQARNKAKIAKKNALLAYLEAKNIKKTYLIEKLDDSDSDIDNEIEEVSDSELADL